MLENFGNATCEEKMAEGRRERLRSRVRREGLDSLEYHEVLELLLYPLIPRKDTNQIAHSLIKEFGSLDKVLQAQPHETIKTKNMTTIASEMLSYFYKINTIAKRSAIDPNVGFASLALCRQYVSTFFADIKSEQLYAFTLDHKYRLIHPSCVATGGLNDVYYNKKKVIEIALKDSARYIIIAHNHLDGHIEPSEADILSTYELFNALKNVECELLDHLILGSEEALSFNERGLMTDIARAKSKAELLA
jgi:DNA repair protein RadC